MIKWCNVCKHYFCDKCRKKFFWRGAEAIKEWLGGRREGCCDENRCHICELRNG
jgi:hypothetical protein